MFLSGSKAAMSTIYKLTEMMQNFLINDLVHELCFITDYKRSQCLQIKRRLKWLLLVIAILT